jgi:hypothetical protein
VEVAIQLSASGLYLPPTLGYWSDSWMPPQTTFSLPVQTAVWICRAEGALVRVVAVQLFVAGLNLPPVLVGNPVTARPPQAIISLPVHTAV